MKDTFPIFFKNKKCQGRGSNPQLLSKTSKDQPKGSEFDPQKGLWDFQKKQTKKKSTLSGFELVTFEH